MPGRGWPGSTRFGSPPVLFPLNFDPGQDPGGGEYADPSHPSDFYAFDGIALTEGGLQDAAEEGRRVFAGGQVEPGHQREILKRGGGCDAGVLPARREWPAPRLGRPGVDPLGVAPSSSPAVEPGGGEYADPSHPAGCQSTMVISLATSPAAQARPAGVGARRASNRPAGSNGRGKRRDRGQLGDRDALERVMHAGGDLAQGVEHKTAVPAGGVRNDEPGIVNYLVAVKNQVEIQRPRAPAFARHASRAVLEICKRSSRASGGSDVSSSAAALENSPPCAGPDGPRADNLALPRDGKCALRPGAPGPCGTFLKRCRRSLPGRCGSEA